LVLLQQLVAAVAVGATSQEMPVAREAEQVAAL
jgi:hypothetical protein